MSTSVFVLFVHFLMPTLFLMHSQPLGRLGASVLGIDPVADSIGTAQLHSSYDPDLRNQVSYQACSLEELSSEGEEGTENDPATGQFDAVVASEVVEHLADVETFAYCCNHVLKVCPTMVYVLPSICVLHACGQWSIN